MMVRSFLSFALVLTLATVARAITFDVDLQYSGSYTDAFDPVALSTTRTVLGDGTARTDVTLGSNAVYHAFEVYLNVSGLAAGQDVVYLQYTGVGGNGVTIPVGYYSNSAPLSIDPIAMGSPSSNAAAASPLKQNFLTVNDATHATFVHEVTRGPDVGGPKGNTYGDFAAYISGTSFGGLGESTAYDVGTLYVQDSAVGGTFGLSFTTNPGYFKVISGNTAGAATGSAAESYPVYTGLGDSIKFVDGAPALASGTLTLTASAVNTQLLKGGTTTINATVGNAAGTGTDTLNWSATGAATGSGALLAAGNTAPVSGSYTGSAYSASLGSPTSVTVSATATNSVLTTAAAGSPASASATINVGLAQANTSGSQTTFGAALIAAVNSGVSLADLSSKTVNSLATEAIIRAGTSSTAGNVSESWRAITGSETPFVFSDVVNVATQTGSNPFVLQMSYRESDLSGVAESKLMLGWLNGSNQWVSAIQGNSSHASDLLINGAWTSGDLTLGHYGVDTVNNVVWAVVDHNSQFAVIPEPGTLALLSTGLLGLLAYAWRKRK